MAAVAARHKPIVDNKVFLINYLLCIVLKALCIT